MADQELLRDILGRMEGKIDVAADNALLAKQAAELLAAKVDDHIEQDRIMHRQIDMRVSPLEHFRTKIMAWVAVVALAGAFLADLTKTAIASILGAGIPPHGS